MNELTMYTWETLATGAGAAAATLFIAQYTKAPLDRWFHMPTRLLVYLIALAIMTCARAATSSLAWTDIPLLLVNAVVVAFSAMGAYETFIGKQEKNEAAETSEDAAEESY